MATAAILLATGLSVIAAVPASANTTITNFQFGCSQAPTAGQNAASVACVNLYSSPQWTLGSATWSPTLSGTFVDNVVHTATYTATASSGFQFSNVPANQVTIRTSDAGSPLIESISNTAVVGTSSTMTIVVTFKPVGGVSTTITELPITVPVVGAQPQSSLTVAGFIPNTPISWSPSIPFNGTFQSGVTYSARVNLNADTGFRIRGASTSTFTVPGANSVVYDPTAQFRLVAVFPAAGSAGSSSSSSSQSTQQAQAAAAAAAAAAFGAGVKLTKTVSAQQNLSSAFLGSKPGSLEDFRAANITVTSTASLNRINAEILKLSALERTDFAKIKALAEKIEFDESFFNPATRPGASTYTAYGVPGVTDRIVAKVNAQVLALPAAQRSDIKAISEIAQAESFIDRVANTETRSTVSTNLLISKGLVTADYPRKHSLLKGLGNYPEGSLNTMAKIEAAIKAEIAKAEAPRLRTAEIRARIAARRG